MRYWRDFCGLARTGINTERKGFALKSETPRGCRPEAIFLQKEVRPLRSVRIRFGKLSVQIPGEILVALCSKAMWLVLLLRR